MTVWPGRRPAVITCVGYRSPPCPTADGYWPTVCDRCAAPCWMDAPTHDVVHTGAIVRVWCDTCDVITRG